MYIVHAYISVTMQIELTLQCAIIGKLGKHLLEQYELLLHPLTSLSLWSFYFCFYFSFIFHYYVLPSTEGLTFTKCLEAMRYARNQET